MRIPITPQPLDRHAGPERAPRHVFLPLILVLIAFPFLIDGIMLYRARYAALTGPMPSVQTPALDLASYYIDETTDSLRKLVRKPFHEVPWSPEWAIGGLIVSLAAGALLLRMSRER